MFHFLVDLLFPKFCFSCHRPGSYLCYECQNKIKTIEYDICPYCKRKSFFGITHPDCKRPFRLDGLKSLLRYDGITRNIIKQIKYRLVREAVKDFFNAISYRKLEELLFYKKLSEQWIFIPVPLHKNRLKKRGFNQSVLFASLFEKILEYPVAINLIARVKDTKSQAGFKNDKERHDNMRNAFELVRNVDVKGKNFIIFDDVFTTGHTIYEVTKVLKNNGANKVMALTIAR